MTQTMKERKRNVYEINCHKLFNGNLIYINVYNIHLVIDILAVVAHDFHAAYSCVELLFIFYLLCRSHKIL